MDFGKSLFSPKVKAAPVEQTDEPADMVSVEPMWGDGTGSALIDDDVAGSLGIDSAALRNDAAVQRKVVDDNDPALSEYFAKYVPDALPFKTFPQMIDNVVAGDQPIDHLEITGHGLPGRQYLGDKLLTADSFDDPSMTPGLERMRDSLAPDARVDLNGCSVAAGDAGDLLLRTAAVEFDAPVTAAYQIQDARPGFEGPTRTCYPPFEGPHGPDDNGDMFQLCTTDNQNFLSDAMRNLMLAMKGHSIQPVAPTELKNLSR